MRYDGRADHIEDYLITVKTGGWLAGVILQIKFMQT